MLARLVCLSVVVVGALLVAACGGAAATPTSAPPPTAAPVPTPTATSPPTVAPTDTPVPPPTETPSLAESVPSGFVELAACLEERVGAEAALALVTGERKESVEEEAALADCLLVTASGVSSETLSPTVGECLEGRLGPGVVEVVGSGARALTAEEEAVLVDCLLASAASAEATDLAFESCLEERLGADIAAVVASGAVPVTGEEQQVLRDCLVETALGTSGETAGGGLAECLEARLGADLAAAVGSGAIPLTGEEQEVLGDCLLRLAVATPEETASEGTLACLEARLGADLAAAVASGALPLTEEEQAALGDCLLDPSSGAATETPSEEVVACLEERLGDDLAAVVASGAIPLSGAEEAVLGDCLLAEAMGSFP